ncbi:MAG: hypothetical protein E5W38_18490, partial [Mesorhizobium sp.]
MVAHSSSEPGRADPFWPAGHLPLKGGDSRFRPCRSSCNPGDWRKHSGEGISPIEGETAGRPEGVASTGLN